MASLKRSPSGSWSTRKVIPEDVRSAYGKREDKATWPASLSETEVRPLFAVWLHQVEKKIADLRASMKAEMPASTASAPTLTDCAPHSLRRSEQIALRATWYAWLKDRFWDQPDDTPDAWEPALDCTRPTDPSAIPDSRGRFAWTISPGLDTLIAEFVDAQSLNLSPASQAEFEWQAVDAYRDFATDVINHLNGDAAQASTKALHGPSKPTEQNSHTGAPSTPPAALTSLLSSYIRERKPQAASIKKFTANIQHLINFVGYEDAARITKQDIQRWRDHLLYDKGLSAKTVKEGYLASANLVYNWAKENDHVASNPASDVKLRSPKVIKLRDKGLTNEEARKILMASLQYQDPKPKTLQAVRRWAPWLCAYTGARINEITQLRSQDVSIVDGLHCITITPDAGSVKTGDSRVIPLHDHIIAQGFVQFANEADGPLFYDPANARGGSDANPQSKKAGERLAKWVRSIGVNDPNVSPNHGWRHRFKTEARLAGIGTKYSDCITGHSFDDESGKYGIWPPVALKREIDKLPTIQLP